MSTPSPGRPYRRRTAAKKKKKPVVSIRRSPLNRYSMHESKYALPPASTTIKRGGGIKLLKVPIMRSPYNVRSASVDLRGPIISPTRSKSSLRRPRLEVEHDTEREKSAFPRSASLSYYFPYSVSASHNTEEANDDSDQEQVQPLPEEHADAEVLAWGVETPDSSSEEDASGEESSSDSEQSLSGTRIWSDSNINVLDVDVEQPIAFAEGEYVIQPNTDFGGRVGRRHIHAVMPPFPALESTVQVHYPCYMTLKRPHHNIFRQQSMSTGEPSSPDDQADKRPISRATDTCVRFKISSEVLEYNVVVNVARWAGLKRTKNTSLCNLYWGKHLAPEQYELLTPMHKVNHFPGTWTLGRKDLLANRLALISKRIGASEFAFVPATFVLPAERKMLECEMELNQGSIWIQKPYSASCGKGIKLIERIGQLGARSKCVVSRYIPNPMLIDGHKFDLRIYAVVSCFDPLRIYLLDDGLVRFATERYSLSKPSLSQRCVHLTNYTLNSKSKSFVRNRNAELNNIGSKWSLKALLQYLQNHKHVDTKQIMAKIHDIVIRTIISVESVVLGKSARYRCPRTACFEVFGFDVLVDQENCPWLLEVNVMPSLSSSSPLDKFIKTKLVADVFHMVGMQVVDAKNNLKAIRKAEHRRFKRVIGLDKNKPAQTISSLDMEDSLPELQRHKQLSRKMLGKAALGILRESEAELQRRGHLERIFPTRDTWQSYEHLFETDRYNNVLLWKWLSLPTADAMSLLH